VIDQVLGIGGASLLVYLSVRLTRVLREGYRAQRAGEADPNRTFER
jgi:hypothetical protein